MTLLGPCWPDVVDTARGALPALGFVVAALAYLALVVILLWVPKVKNKWIRLSFRVVGTIGGLSILIPLPAILFGVALASGNPPTQSVVYKSPGGQEATLKYSAGFLGRDYTEVVLKHSDSCQHVTIFSHAGPSDLQAVKVEWIDEHHLRVLYYTRPDDPRHCESRSGDVAIICFPHQ